MKAGGQLSPGRRVTFVKKLGLSNWGLWLNLHIHEQCDQQPITSNNQRWACECSAQPLTSRVTLPC